MRDIRHEFPPHGLQMLHLRDVTREEEDITVHGPRGHGNDARDPTAPREFHHPLRPRSGGLAAADNLRDLVVAGQFDHRAAAHRGETRREERQRGIIDREDLLPSADHHHGIVQGGEDRAEAAVLGIQ